MSAEFQSGGKPKAQAPLRFRTREISAPPPHPSQLREELPTEVRRVAVDTRKEPFQGDLASAGALT